MFKCIKVGNLETFAKKGWWSLTHLQVSMGANSFFIACVLLTKIVFSWVSYIDYLFIIIY